MSDADHLVAELARALRVLLPYAERAYQEAHGDAATAHDMAQARAALARAETRIA